MAADPWFFGVIAHQDQPKESYIDKPVIEFWATRYRVLDEWYPSYGHIAGGIYVEEVRQSRESADLRYAVRMRDNYALGKDGSWDQEPIPSSRTDEWLDNHRWDDLHSARQAANDAAQRILEAT